MTAEFQADAQRVLEKERDVLRRFRSMREGQFTVMRIRTRGDYHLGQVLYTGKERQELQVLLDTYILEKAVYELAYELNNRPPWVGIPLHGILQIIASAET